MTAKSISKFSISTVKQGEYTFYTLTIPSDVLADTCFVTTRDEDPKMGFQRVLDEKRAKDIAEYIDTGQGTIPTSIILSAQEEAEVAIDRNKTIRFNNIPKAFLILDGQHRVWGFSMSKKIVRVPVVVYNGLSRKEETRLFIDINTKQKRVTNELLLDIKSLAEQEKPHEELLRDLFDLFNNEPDSVMLGLLSPSSSAKNKITRVTFNRAVKPILELFTNNSMLHYYNIVNAYLNAFIYLTNELGAKSVITNKSIFTSAIRFFPDVTRRVNDRFNGDLNSDNYIAIMNPVFANIKPSVFSKPSPSHTTLTNLLEKGLKQDLII